MRDPRKIRAQVRIIGKKYIRHNQGRAGIYIPAEVWERVVTEYRAGWTKAALADRLGISYEALSRQFTLRGEPVRRRGRQPGRGGHDPIITTHEGLERQALVKMALLEAKTTPLIDLEADEEP